MCRVPSLKCQRAMTDLKPCACHAHFHALSWSFACHAAWLGPRFARQGLRLGTTEMQLGLANVWPGDCQVLTNNTYVYKSVIQQNYIQQYTTICGPSLQNMFVQTHLHSPVEQRGWPYAVEQEQPLPHYLLKAMQDDSDCIQQPGAALSWLPRRLHSGGQMPLN